MKKTTIAIMIIVAIANGGKVNWDNLDANGRPTIGHDKNKQIKGCNLGSLGSLGQDNNSSKSCS